MGRGTQDTDFNKGPIKGMVTNIFGEDFRRGQGALRPPYFLIVDPLGHTLVARYTI